MRNQVIYLRSGGATPRSILLQRLAGVISMLEEIDSHELLAALPECPVARQNHLTASNLLLSAEAELRGLYSEMAD